MLDPPESDRVESPTGILRVPHHASLLFAATAPAPNSVKSRAVNTSKLRKGQLQTTLKFK